MEIVIGIILGVVVAVFATAIGLIGHGLFDFIHHRVIENAGMPLWWPGFCGSVDVTLGLFMVFYLLRSRVPT